MSSLRHHDASSFLQLPHIRPRNGMYLPRRIVPSLAHISLSSSESDPEMEIFVSSSNHLRTYLSWRPRCASVLSFFYRSSKYSQILETSPDADPATITLSNQPRGGEYPISKLSGRNLESLGLKCASLPSFNDRLLTNAILDTVILYL
jgi:hypothetical protein